MTKFFSLFVFNSLLIAALFALPQFEQLHNDQALLQQTSTLAANEYHVGVGVGDITGPIGTKLCGYDIPSISSAIQTRLFAKAFVFSKTLTQPLAYVVVDRFMISHMILDLILDRIAGSIGQAALPVASRTYTRRNVVFMATHTHSGTSVYTEAGILQLSEASVNFTLSDSAFVSGACDALKIAHFTRLGFQRSAIQGCDVTQAELLSPVTVPTPQVGVLFHRLVTLNNAGVNQWGLQRSPQAHDAYKAVGGLTYAARATGVDATHVIVKIMLTGRSEPLGILTWAKTQSTILTRDSKVISGDNKGIAGYLLERMVGKSGFVAAFASGGMGDVTSNIQGPRCINNSTRPVCDFSVDMDVVNDTEVRFTLTNPSQCGGSYMNCQAVGPADTDIVANALIIGSRIANLVYSVINVNGTVDSHTSPWQRVTGNLHSAISYQDITAQVVDGAVTYPACGSALGKSYLSGTVDGTAFNTDAIGITPGMTNTTDTVSSEIVSFAAGLLAVPKSDALKQCQGAKAIIGGEEVTATASYCPRDVSVQIFSLGGSGLATSLVTVHVPFVLTNGAANELVRGVSFGSSRVVPVSVANNYRGYLTSVQEYDVQRFEGAITAYGPNSVYKMRTFVRGVASCLYTGCVEPGVFTQSGQCSSPNKNCHPYFSTQDTVRMNEVAVWALDTFGQLNDYKPGTGMRSDVGLPVPNGVSYSTNSAGNYSVSCQFYTVSQFTVKTMTNNFLRIQFGSSETVFGPVVYTERDPETVVHYRCTDSTGSDCVATIRLMFPPNFNFATNSWMRVSFDTYSISEKSNPNDSRKTDLLVSGSLVFQLAPPTAPAVVA